MAPVSRCNLRLPRTPKESSKESKSNAGSAKSKFSDPATTLVGKLKSSSSVKSKSSVGSKGKRSDSSVGSGTKRRSDTIEAEGTVETTEKSKATEKPKSTDKSKSTEKPKTTERHGKSQEFSDDMGIELNTEENCEKDSEKVPESAHDERTRDSAEVLEQDTEFRTTVTRDSYEAEQHAGHDVGGELDSGLDACEILRRCKAEVEEANAAGECEQMTCPRLDQIGTPGDVCAQFCHDRMDSPKSVADLDVASTKKSKYCAKWSKKTPIECDMRLGPRKKHGKDEVVCKGTYKSQETYTSLWGSSQALEFRKRLEMQMKKKRKLLEKMHQKEFVRRQKMRRRAKEKRRALKQRDPSKISNGDDNLRINKAYDLRVNYNKQLPMMPVTMQQHFDKFKKPPFKTYVTGQRVCTKRIDEFEKLRVPEKDKK